MMARVWGDYIGVARRSVRFGSKVHVLASLRLRQLILQDLPNVILRDTWHGLEKKKKKSPKQLDFFTFKLLRDPS